MKLFRQAAGLVWYNREAVIWILALVLLAFDDPGSHHYTLCPFHSVGLTICPGCGLGRSISLFFHGDPAASFMMHPLGIPAVFLLAYRAVKLIIRPENKKSITKIHSYG